MIEIAWNPGGRQSSNVSVKDIFERQVLQIIRKIVIVFSFWRIATYRTILQSVSVQAWMKINQCSYYVLRSAMMRFWRCFTRQQRPARSHLFFTRQPSFGRVNYLTNLNISNHEPIFGFRTSQSRCWISPHWWSPAMCVSMFISFPADNTFFKVIFDFQ